LSPQELKGKRRPGKRIGKEEGGGGKIKRFSWPQGGRREGLEEARGKRGPEGNFGRRGDSWPMEK